jgi:hypothetical protein
MSDTNETKVENIGFPDKNDSKNQNSSRPHLPNEAGKPDSSKQPPKSNSTGAAIIGGVGVAAGVGVATGVGAATNKVDPAALENQNESPEATKNDESNQNPKDADVSKSENLSSSGNIQPSAINMNQSVIDDSLKNSSGGNIEDSSNAENHSVNIVNQAGGTINININPPTPGPVEPDPQPGPGPDEPDPQPGPDQPDPDPQPGPDQPDPDLPVERTFVVSWIDVDEDGEFNSEIDLITNIEFDEIEPGYDPIYFVPEENPFEPIVWIDEEDIDPAYFEDIEAIAADDDGLVSDTNYYGWDGFDDETSVGGSTSGGEGNEGSGGGYSEPGIDELNESFGNDFDGESSYFSEENFS